MSFPNARKGVKLLLAAQILFIVSSFVVLASTVLAIVSANKTLTTVASILAIASGVALLIASLLDLIGYGKAARDDKHFAVCLVLILLGLIATIVATILTLTGKGPKLITTLLPAISDFFQELTILFAIFGLCSLSKKVGDEKNIRYGKALLGILIAIYCIWLASNVILIFFPTAVTAIIITVLTAVESIMIIVSYFMYLTYLSKVSKMLR